MADFLSRPVVCNSGPMIALSRSEVGFILPQLFPKVITTQSVLEEVTAKDAEDAVAIRATLLGIEAVVTQEPEPLLKTELDVGEASDIQAARDEAALL